MRGRLPVLAGAAAGLAAAIVLTLLQSSTYRADASIALVRQGQPPGDDPALAQAAEAAVDLIHSRAVAEPAVANLRLDETADELLERVEVDSEPRSSLIRISVEAPSRDEARRTAQELTELATVLFNDRFGPETAASVWEAPRADDDRVSPNPALNLALGVLLGALAGRLLPLLAGRRRPRRPRGRVHAAADRSAPPPPAAAAGVEGRWPRPARVTLAELERRAGSSPELSAYLLALREFADADGRLPAKLEPLLVDVFGDAAAR